MFISDINECDSTPCSNGGICSNSPGSFDCTCDGTGYDGDLCEDGEWKHPRIQKVFSEGVQLFYIFFLLLLLGRERIQIPL